jgi:uncharacterized protein (TIGR00290 family)
VIDPKIGLCTACRHARRIASARGSTFWQCGRASSEPAFARYPRLPVERCDGFEATTAKLPPTDGVAAVAWSGGKDSSLARHRALLSGYRVPLLLNMCGPEGAVRFHGVEAALIDAQAEALGCEVLRVPTAPERYEPSFMDALGRLRARGVAGIVFGNLHLADVQAWFEERTTRSGLVHVEPLWGWPPALVVEQFLAAGFRAVVVSVMADRIDRRWVGAPFDARFLAMLAGLPGVDPCGERGEYHTFVYDGPGFRAPVPFALGEPIASEGYWITPARRA